MGYFISVVSASQHDKITKHRALSFSLMIMKQREKEKEKYMREKKSGTSKLQVLVPNNRNNNHKTPVVSSWQCAVLHDTSAHRGIISREASSTLMRLFILLVLHCAQEIAR